MTAEPHVILIAEDQPVASMALRAQLEALGHRVVGAARDAEEAVALGRCFPVDVALFDLRMPGRSGLDAATELFDHDPVPVVLLTGVGVADLPSPIRRPPVFAVLTKPTGMAELNAGIRHAAADFERWARENRWTDRIRDSRRDREVIARAIGEPGTEDPAPSARRLIERARREGRTLLELAREILDERR